MPFNLSAADKVLKEFYLPAVREQLNNATPLLATIGRNETDVQGRRAVIAVHTGRNQGIGARAESGTLPEAGNQKYDNLIYTMKYNYGRIQITGPTIAATRSDAGSFVRAVKSEMDGLVTDLKFDYNRQLFGNGGGRLCTLAAASNSATVNVTDHTLWLQTGMIVDIYAASGGSPTGSPKYTGLTVTAVGSSSVTFSSNVTTAAGDIVVRTGAANQEVEGLEAIISDSNTYAGINRSHASNSWWRANIFANGGTNRSLSENLMQQVWDACERYGDARRFFLITSPGVRRAYANLMTSLRRYVNTIEVKGGFKGFEFNGVPLVVDYHCPPNRIYFLDLSHISLFRMSDWDWLDMDGAILSRVRDRDAYEATMYKYSNLGVDRSNCHGLLADITEA